MAEKREKITIEKFCNQNGIAGIDRFVAMKKLNGFEATDAEFAKMVASRCGFTVFKQTGK